MLARMPEILCVFWGHGTLNEYDDDDDIGLEFKTSYRSGIQNIIQVWNLKHHTGQEYKTSYSNLISKPHIGLEFKTSYRS